MLVEDCRIYLNKSHHCNDWVYQKDIHFDYCNLKV
jgi:hypothetical protein